MEYFARDFENLLLNVYLVPVTTNLLKKFPILGKYNEFKIRLPNQLPRNKVIRYTVFAFDRNSPLNGINDILERRIQACLLAGFKYNTKGEWPEMVDKMLRSLLPKVNHIIIRYCIIQATTDWAIKIAFEDALEKELKRLLDNTDDDKTSKILDTISKLRVNIKKIDGDLLAENVDQFLTRSLAEMGQAKILELSPEYYAEHLKGWDNISKYYKLVRQKPVQKHDKDEYPKKPTV